MSVVWNHTVDEVLGDEHGVTGVRLQRARRRRAPRRSTSPACSSPSATRRTPASSTASSTCATATSPITQRHRRRCHRHQRARACSPPATSPTTSTARRSPPPAPAAWPRSMPTATSRRSTRRRTADARAACASVEFHHSIEAVAAARVECAGRRRQSRSCVTSSSLALEHTRLRRPRHAAGSRATSRCAMRTGSPAAAPAFVKTHSYGEFVFDFAWARATRGSGAATTRSSPWPRRSRPPPVRACWCAPALDRDALTRTAAHRARAVRGRATRSRRVHALFLDEAARAACAARGWLLRRDCQFHWTQPRLRELRGLSRHLHRREAQEGAPRAPARRRGRHTLRDALRRRAR